MTEYNNERYPYMISVKFSGNQKSYSFGTHEAEWYAYGDKVVVETVNGPELGTCVSDTRNCEDFKVNLPLKPVLRKAKLQDFEQFNRNLEDAKAALDTCREMVKRLDLDMNMISAEYTLDRSKIIFVYVADERVDFRELLKELASSLRCRIELKQIGPRDKAKMVGGIGVCGRMTCCSRHMNSFDVISINMAKNQMLALNVAKLSGQCGKLMCCLKFENDDYSEARKNCPKQNQQVEYNGKKYRVTSMNVITHQAKLENREEVLYLDFDEAFKDYRKKESEHEKTKELSE